MLKLNMFNHNHHLFRLKVLEKLANVEFRYIFLVYRPAWEFTQEAIRAILGIGESKALSIIHWCEVLENSQRKVQLTAIPEKIA